MALLYMNTFYFLLTWFRCVDSVKSSKQWEWARGTTRAFFGTLMPMTKKKAFDLHGIRTYDEYWWLAIFPKYLKVLREKQNPKIVKRQCRDTTHTIRPNQQKHLALLSCAVLCDPLTCDKRWIPVASHSSCKKVESGAFYVVVVVTLFRYSVQSRTSSIPLYTITRNCCLLLVTTAKRSSSLCGSLFCLVFFFIQTDNFTICRRFGVLSCVCLSDGVSCPSTVKRSIGQLFFKLSQQTTV